MAKNPQVILKGAQYREIERVARSHHMSIAEWAPAAAQHNSPSGDMDRVLEEIESGYGSARSVDPYR
jgi:hypothetical protein